MPTRLIWTIPGILIILSWAIPSPAENMSGTRLAQSGSVGGLPQLEDEDEQKKTDDSSTANEVYKLSELLERARKNPDFKKEHRSKLDEAQWTKYRADWAWTPKLESRTLFAPVPANADPNEVNENFDEIAALEIGPFIQEELEAVVPLYTFGQISTSQELAELGIDKVRLDKKRSLLNRYYQVKRAFYSLQLSEKLDGLLNEGDELIKEKLDKMQEQRDFGRADFAIKDLRKLQIFSAEVDKKILDNQRLEEIAKDGLHVLTELQPTDIAVPEMDKDEDPAELRSEDYYVEKALKNRPRIVQLRKGVRARRLQVELEESKFYPTVFAAGSFTVAWSTENTRKRPVCQVQDNGKCVDVEGRFVRPSDPLHKFNFEIGLGMRWKFDFSQRRGKLGEAEAKYETILAQMNRAERAVRLDVKRLYKEARDARRKIEMVQRKVDAARRWKQQFGLSIDSGGAELEDAIDALKAHFKAMAEYYRARYEYSMARASLVKGVGLRKLSDEGMMVENTTPIFNSK